jgi:hypothetical protein
MGPTAIADWGLLILVGLGSRIKRCAIFKTTVALKQLAGWSAVTEARLNDNDIWEILCNE